MNNYTVQDIVGTLLAFGLYPLFLFIPGYVAGWLTNVLQFRQRRVVTRILLAIVLSISICPILTYLLAHFLTFTGVWIAYGITWIVFVVIIVVNIRRHLRSPRQTVNRLVIVAGIMVVVWILIGVFSMADIQIGNRLYFSIVSYDYTTRISLVNAITRTGIPPANPNFFPGQPVDVSYFYLWFLICSLVERLGQPLITARFAFMGSTLWAAIGLMAVIPLYLRFNTATGAKDIGTRSVVGIGLLSVTGLDILPITMMNIRRFQLGASLIEDMEWWDTQVTAWVGSMIWIPHHIASLVVCIMALIIFQSLEQCTRTHQKIIALVLAGLAFASSAGMSVYVTLIFAAFWSVWSLFVLLRKRDYRQFVNMVVVGGLGLIIAAPFLIELLSTGQARSGIPLAFTIHPFISPSDALGYMWQVRLIDFVVLPAIYLLELGFFVVAARVYLQWRKPINSREVCLLLTSVLICTFVKSDILANDLGWRGFLFAQFVMLIWSVDIFIAMFRRFFVSRNVQPVINRVFRPATRLVLIILLVLGVASSIYDLVDLRIYPIVMDSGAIPLLPIISTDHQLGQRTYAFRQAYEYILHTFPANTIIQYNPTADFGNVERFNGLYGFRQVAASDEQNAVMYAVTDSAYKVAGTPVLRIFLGTSDVSTIRATCATLKISLLFVKDTDPVWRDGKSWVWQQSPVFQNEFARVFDCKALVSTLVM